MEIIERCSVTGYITAGSLSLCYSDNHTLNFPGRMIHLTQGPPLTACFQKRSNRRALFTKAESGAPLRHLLHSNHLNVNRDHRCANVVYGFKFSLFPGDVSVPFFIRFSRAVGCKGSGGPPLEGGKGREGSASAEDVGMLDKCLQHHYFCCSRIPKEESYTPMLVSR